LNKHRKDSEEVLLIGEAERNFFDSLRDDRSSKKSGSQRRKLSPIIHMSQLKVVSKEEKLSRKSSVCSKASTSSVSPNVLVRKAPKKMVLPLNVINFSTQSQL